PISRGARVRGGAVVAAVAAGDQTCDEHRSACARSHSRRRVYRRPVKTNGGSDPIWPDLGLADQEYGSEISSKSGSEPGKIGTVPIYRRAQLTKIRDCPYFS